MTETTRQRHQAPESPGTSPLVRLRDGSLVAVRRVAGAAEAALHTFLAGLSPEARRLRFFSGGADMGTAAHAAAEPGAGRYGLLVHDETGALVGHALYVPMDPTHAEVAVEVADHLHGRGLGTILIERLAAAAEQHGITHFTAEVLPENHAMLDVFRDAFGAHVRLRDGVNRVELPTASWRRACSRYPQPA